MQLMNIRYKMIADFCKEDFPGMIIDWIINTKDLRYHMEFEEKPFNGYQVYKYQRKELSIIEYAELNTIAALHKDTDAFGVDWVLSVVFKEKTHEIFIRMGNSKTTEDGRFMAKFRKPDLIDELVDLNYLDMDHDIPMIYDAHNVSVVNPEEFLAVLNRKAKFTLPVIYIALGPYNIYGINPDTVADIYAGMAHVFAQDHKDCFEKLIAGTEKYVPKNGEVAIYFPNENMSEIHLPLNKYDEKGMMHAISKAIHFFYHNQSFGPLTTYEEIASRAISIRNKNLKDENAEVHMENQRVSMENSELFSTFDTDLKKSAAEMEKLKKKMRELELENEILRNRVDSFDEKPVLFYGNEEELYVGEIKEILLDILQSNVNVTENSRREHIIKDLLQANNATSSVKERHSKVKNALANYRDMTPDVRKALEEVGFEITSEGKHHKLVYQGDSRYQISISKTASDHKSGLNAATLITKTMM